MVYVGYPTTKCAQIELSLQFAKVRLLRPLDYYGKRPKKRESPKILALDPQATKNSYNTYEENNISHNSINSSKA
jgi:hypothetical protein